MQTISTSIPEKNQVRFVMVELLEKFVQMLSLLLKSSKEQDSERSVFVERILELRHFNFCKKCKKLRGGGQLSHISIVTEQSKDIMRYLHSANFVSSSLFW